VYTVDIASKVAVVVILVFEVLFNLKAIVNCSLVDTVGDLIYNVAPVTVPVLGIYILACAAVVQKLESSK